MREMAFVNSERTNIARERFLRYLIDGHRDCTDSDVCCRMKNLGITEWGPYFMVIEISLHMDLYPAQQIDHMLLRIEDFSMRYFKDSGFAVNGYIDSRNSLIVMLNAYEKQAFVQIDKVVTKLIKRLMSDTGIVIYAGIGRVVSTPTEIKHSAKDANRCIEYKYSIVKENVIDIKDVNRIVSRKNTDNTTAFDRVIGCFLDGDLQKLTVRLGELLKFLEKAQSSLQTVRHVYLELITQIMHRLSDAGISIDKEQASSYLQFILNEQDTQRMKEWFINRCSEFIYEMSQKRQESTSQISQAAKKYVERNYSDPDISQQSVSDFMGLSIGYFGQIFFAQTGQRFIDYLHQYRLEIAVNRLLTSNDKIKDVSTAVGFSNVNYFNALFKKTYSMTPKEYRTKNQI